MALPEKIEAAAKLNRDELPEKQRIYALAKQLELASKDLLQVVSNAGISGKVASSTLNRQQQNSVLDELVRQSSALKTELVDANDAESQAPGEPQAPAESAPEAPAAQAADDEQAGKPAEPEVADENEEAVTSGKSEEPATTDTEPTEKEPENPLIELIEEAQGEEALSEVLSEITPQPATEPPVATPVFSAPLFSANYETASGKTAEERPESVGKDSASNNDARAAADDDEVGSAESSKRRRRGSRGRGRGRGAQPTDSIDADNKSEELDDEEVDVAEISEPKAIHGSTRLEAQRRRRVQRKAMQGRPAILSEAEFLARRESVQRRMVVRDHKRRTEHGRSASDVITQIGVLEDDLLVEHFVASADQASQVGNIYLGRVQNVLPSMEAAFVDIGTGRNGVLYAGELDWRAFGKAGRARKIEKALKAGDQVLVQVTKDPLGHKGARLSTQISIAGRFLVYVPNGRSAGISRKLPAPERKRLKNILRAVVHEDTGIIIRTAAEGVEKQKIERDVQRLSDIWDRIQERTEAEMASKGAKPILMYEEPDTLIKVVRDLFTEDFDELVVEGQRSWDTVQEYVHTVAPDLEERLERYEPGEHDGADVFEHYRIDEQLAKALERKVWLPSGGTLVIDRTEAMTVIDVNTGKFTGSGGNLEETVTLNNLEAAEEIVRQMRLRDLGGMIVVDFIDMVLPENQELVLRRLREFLGRDRTRHQVSEVTSLGLVQMTRKKLGNGLLETFSTPCPACGGRGLILHEEPIQEEHPDERPSRRDKPRRNRDDEAPGRSKGDNAKARRGRRRPDKDPQQHPAALAMSHPFEESAEDSSSNGSADHSDGAAETSSRRRGRRVVRRPETPESERSTVESVVSKIAAEAVAAADLADPDEPSGANYVADYVVDLRESEEVKQDKAKEPAETADGQSAERPAVRRHRSRSSRRGASSVLVGDQRSTSEDPSDSVNSEGQVSKNEQPQTQPVKAGETSGRKRRRVRVSRQFTRPETQKQEQQTQAQSLEAQDAKQSYKEQLAEFEKSPRRKRKTRGRSKSDFPPKPETIEAAKSNNSSSGDIDEKGAMQPSAAAPKADSASSAEQQPDPGAKSPSISSRSRRGRRTVRRVSKSEASSSGQSRQQAGKPAAETESAKSAAEQRPTPRKRSGRGGRRVVRRS